jgi:hypothetical protein
MDRRDFNKLTGLAAVGIAAKSADLFGYTGEWNGNADASLQDEVVLEDKELLVAFNKATGALTRMVRKSSRWVMQQRPELGVSFRLSVPLPGRRTNFVFGSKQHADHVQKLSENELQIRWKNPVSEHGGVIPLTFEALIKLDAGELVFSAIMTNDSEYMIETIDYPYFGDLNPPTREMRMVAHHMWVGALEEAELYPHFSNELGYWGVRFPTKNINSNQSQFCLIQTPQEGLYVGMHDPEIRYFLQFTFEQYPGTVDWVSGEVPQEDAISGLPVHLNFRTCHFAFVHPHSTVELAPVVVRPYSGDWHNGLDVYRSWRKTWFGAPTIPAWAREVHSWLQLQVNGAEQDYSIPYRNIVKYGEECAQNGVGAIQLVGWNHGGQDGGDPSLDTDPGLGTWQDLHDAIAQIQAKGVKMILFGKPVFADMSTEWYRNELHKYEAIDPWGNKYESGGYSYETPTQLAGINNRRRAIMDVCSEEYRDIAMREFEKILALGAAGWLFDEVMQHNGVIYNFSPAHGYNPPGYLFNADIPLAKQFRFVADKVNREFLFAGEGPGDWMMPYYTLGYYRIGAGTRHALRYIDPKVPLMAAVRGFNARDEINLILAYRYIISYEPYNFKGHVTDFPLTLAYGKKVDALRHRYREYLWDGEFRDTVGASVAADGVHRYTVFVAENGKRAVVVVNLEQDRYISATISLINPGNLATATPEDPESQITSGEVKIPERSAAVVFEL